MAKDGVVRSYSLQLRFPAFMRAPAMTPSLDDIIERTHYVYNHGAEAFIDLHLTLLAGYDPSFGMPPQIKIKPKKIKKPKGKKKAVVAELPTDPMSMLSPELLAFMFWFSLESKDQAPADYIVEPAELLPRYQKYAGTDSYPEEVSLLAHFSFSEEAVWVDRRAMFLDRQKHFGITKSGLQTFFNNPKMPLFSGGDDSAQFWRDVYSTWWGTGPKSAWDSVINFSNEIKAFDWKSQIGKRRSDVIRNIFVSRLGVAVVNDEYCTMPYKSGGAPKGINITIDKWLNDPQPFTDEDVERVLKGANDACKNADYKLSVVIEPWMQKLKEWIEDATNVTFHCNRYATMSGLAWRHVRNKLSQNLNQLIERQKYWRIVNKAHDVPEEICKILTTYKKDRQAELEMEREFYIRNHQLNGLSDLFAAWKEDPTDPEAARINAQSGYEGRFGDPKVFAFLTQHSCLLQIPSPAYHITNWVAADNARFKLERLQLPYLRHIDPEKYPVFAEFGTSRPTVSFRLSAADDTRWDTRPILDRSKLDAIKGNPIDSKQPVVVQQVASVKLDLYDGKGFQTIEVPIAGSKAVQELMTRYKNTQHYKLNRNHKISRKFANLEEGSPVQADINLESIGTKLFFKGEERWRKSGIRRWYLLISPMVKTFQSITAKEVEKLPLGMRLIGIDLGVRNAAYQTTWEICPAPTDESVDFFEDEQGRKYSRIRFDNKVYAWARMISEGSLETKMKRYGGQIFDVLTDLGHELTEEDQQLYEEMSTFFNWQERKPCKFIGELLLNLARGLMTKISGDNGLGNEKTRVRNGEAAPYVGPEHRAALMRLIRAFFNKGVPMGGLTFERIETLTTLISAANGYLYKTKPKNEEVKPEQDPELHDWIQIMWRRARQMKKERIRLTVNRIINHAIEHDVKVIVHEDLESLNTSRNQLRVANRRLGRWCPKQVLAQLKDQARFYGLFLRMTNPAWTSTFDPCDRNMRCLRFREIKVCDLDSKWTGKYIDKHLSKKQKSVYSVRVRAICAEYGANSAEKLKEVLTAKGIETIYIPFSDGDFFESSKLGMISRDLVGAWNVAIRGICPYTARDKVNSQEEVEAKTA